MGIFSRNRTSTKNQTTVNNFDNRRVETTTNEGDFAGASGISISNTTTSTAPEAFNAVESIGKNAFDYGGEVSRGAFDYGEKAFETIKEITTQQTDALTNSLAGISESANSSLAAIVADRESGGQASTGKYFPLTALALAVGVALAVKG